MFHHASFVTTSQHHRDQLVERASSLTGERPRVACPRRRGRHLLERITRRSPPVAAGAGRF
jgi:hypothetical protein